MAYVATRTRASYCTKAEPMREYSSANFTIVNIVGILLAILAAIVTFLLYASSKNIEAGFAAFMTIVTILAAAYVPKGVYR